MTSRGRPIYQPSILQVKQTSDYKTKRTKRQIALQKKQEAIKKAIKQEKKGSGEEGEGQNQAESSKVSSEDDKGWYILREILICPGKVDVICQYSGTLL